MEDVHAVPAVGSFGACLAHASRYQDLPLRSFQIPFHAHGSGQSIAWIWGE